MNEEQINFHLQTGDWIIEEATLLIKKYKACKTAHAQNRMRPQLLHMKARLAFQGRENEKLMKEFIDNIEGEDWKNEEK